MAWQEAAQREPGWLGTGRDAKMYLKHGSGLRATPVPLALITTSLVNSVQDTRRLFRDLISTHSLDSWKPKEDDNPSAQIAVSGP